MSLTCLACTYDNIPGSSRCEMCGTIVSQSNPQRDHGEPLNLDNDNKKKSIEIHKEEDLVEGIARGCLVVTLVKGTTDQFQDYFQQQQQRPRLEFVLPDETASLPCGVVVSCLRSGTHL